uniref:Uncharacterized protein n=1 Tax=Haemonchus contortus TaxID=6289 RepID=W6ND54_HAECO
MVRYERIKILMILPNDFRARSSAFSEGPDVERRLYGTLNDIGTLLESSAACICVLVGPTTDELIAKCEWYELATSLATAARTGITVIAVAPPREDKLCAKSSPDMIEAIELAKLAAVFMKQGLRCLIQSTESSRNPNTDTELIQEHILSTKLCNPWVGQFRVTEVNHPRTTIVSISATQSAPRKVNMNQIKKCFVVSGPVCTTPW